MEIGPYLRSRPRLTALAVLITLASALGAWVVLSNQDARYTATATVSVPGSASDSASRVGIFVANFAQLATDDDVVRTVSRAVRVPPADLRDDLEVARIGQSSLFTVSWTDQDRRAVEPVVREVIDATFARQLPVARTDAALDLANQSYQAALAERRGYEDVIGTLQPDRDYADVSSKIRSLQAESTATSTFLQNRAREQALTELTAQRDALVPQVRRMQELDQAVSTGASQVDEAEQSAASARQDAQEAQSPTTVLSLDVADASSTASVLQGVGVAAVAGLLVGIALLVLPDVVGRRPRGTGVPAEGSEPVDGSEGSEPTDGSAEPAPTTTRRGRWGSRREDLQEVGHGR